MPPTIAELIANFPPPPPMTRETANHGTVANNDWLNWARCLADLKDAQAAGVIAASHAGVKGLTLEGF